MKSPEITVQIRSALRALGANVAEVRANLGAIGIKGRVGDGCKDPLARHLQRLTNLPEQDLCVFDRDLQFEVEGEQPVKVDLPQPCVDFVNGFDMYRYPELVESEEMP